MAVSALGPKDQRVIRLTAEPAEDRYAFTLSRDAQVLFTSIDPIDVAERMLALGIENPLHLVEAARQWGVVEIKETVRQPNNQPYL